MKKKVRIFISSPSDVEIERHIALQVIQRLEKRYANVLDIKPILWEREPLLASGHFQDALDPRVADIMVCMLWSRLGSPLPNSFTGNDGQTGLTGSEWEFEKALQSYEQTGKPELLVYRKTSRISTNLDDINKAQLALDQKKKVEEFFLKHFHNQDELSTFKRAYFPFDLSDEFEQQLELHLQPLLESHLNSDDEHAFVSWFEGSPFQGLSAFEEKHNPVFFGRTKATGDVLSQYQRQIKAQKNFLMISGMSGCGKSSLLNAGILPLIKTPRVVDFNVGYIEVIRFRLFDFTEDRHPLLLLCEQIINSLAVFTELGIDAETLVEQIQKSPKSLVNTFTKICSFLAQANSLHANLEARVQLIIDQAEENFTNKFISSEQQTEFWHGIEMLTNTKYVWCLGTIRSDFVGHGQNTPLFTLMRGEGDYKLQPPNISELRQIIEEPAKAAGVEFEKDEYNVSLSEIILQDSKAQDGSLALIAFCLDELYRLANKDTTEHITLSLQHYQETLRGIGGAITNKAEFLTQQMQTEGVNVDNLFPKLFNTLIQVNPDATKQTATAKIVDKGIFGENEDLNMLVETFISARLITVSGSSIRLAHETLITRWQRIGQWLATDREFQTFKAKVERDTSVWKQENKSKSRLLNKGKPLSDATTWLSHRADDLLPDTISFIQLSIKNEASKRLRRIMMITGTFVVLVGLTIYSFFQQQQAIENEQLALEQKQRVEALLDNVRQNLDFMTTDLKDVLEAYAPSSKRIPVMEKVDKLSESLFQEGNSSINRDLATQATIITQKADLMQLNTSLDPASSLDLYKKALEIRKSLVLQEPNNIDYQLTLATSYLNLGIAYERDGKAVLGETYLLNALEILQKVLIISPKSMEAKLNLVAIYQALSDSYSSTGDADKSVTMAKTSISLIQQLLEESPNNSALLGSLYNAHGTLGEAQQLRGNALSAVNSIEKAILIAEKLLLSDPTNLTLLDDLSYYYELLGNAQQESLSLELSLDSLLKSKSLAQELVKLDPDNNQFQQALSSAYFRLGEVYEQTLELNKSLDSYKRALALDLDILQKDPNNFHIKQKVAFDYQSVGYVYNKLGKSEEAFESSEKGIAIFSKLAQQQPSVAIVQSDYARLLLTSGDNYVTTENFEQALNLYEQSKTITNKLLEKEPNNAKHLDDLALVVERIALTQIDQAEYEKAFANYMKVYEILTDLSVRDPNNKFYKRNAAMALLGLGDIKGAQGKMAESMDYYEQELSLRRNIFNQDTNSSKDQRALRGALITVADVYFVNGQIDKATIYIQEAIELSDILVKTQPNNYPFKLEQYDAYDFMIELKEAVGDSMQASHYAKKAIQILEFLASQKFLNENDSQNLERLKTTYKE